jgi:hypothetical protein
MTDKQTPADWVLVEAAKRSGWGEYISTDGLREGYADYKNIIGGKAFRALCDMIEKHEQPPVDRKLLCAREADRMWREDGCPAFCKGDDNPIAIRAIELWEKGFGK